MEPFVNHALSLPILQNEECCLELRDLGYGAGGTHFPIWLITTVKYRSGFSA